MPKFEGFSKETLAFFAGLKKNNSSAWFDEHRKEYEQFVKRPTQLFVQAMEEPLMLLDSGINAVPKVNHSIFRLNRDTRFSNDKTPYKTNLGVWFWSGVRPRMECSGFYLQVENGEVMLGTGIYMFPRQLIGAYRDAVADPKKGALLAKLAAKLEKDGYGIGGEYYKKVPAGYDKDSPQARFLRYNGIYAGFETKVPKEFHSAKFVDWCFIHFQKTLPLHQWLKDTLG